jgi:hypothetical protein
MDVYLIIAPSFETVYLILIYFWLNDRWNASLIIWIQSAQIP